MPSSLPRQDARPALPVHPELLPPLGVDFWDTVDEGLALIDVTLSVGARAAIDAQARLLFAWNGAINLTALREPAQVARRHVLDSLSAVPLCRQLVRDAAGSDTRAWRFIDLGSGAGYPGLPLAVGLPFAACSLIDSVRKKARFLEVVSGAASRAMAAAGDEPPAFAARAERAEDLADEPDDRGAWPLVTARAVGTLAEVVELALPLLAQGGHLLAWKRDAGDGSLASELAAAAGIIRQTGGARPIVHGGSGADRLGLPGHVLVSVRKVRPTPARFPRPPAERRRAPLT